MKRALSHLRPWLLLLAAMAAGAGCSSSPPEAADAEQARSALNRALDAWQHGESAESLKQQDPALVVIDYDWESGFRLLRYQVEQDLAVGAERRCQVKLSLRNSRGQTVEKKAIYSIGTHKALTVVREEDS
jgi:hypothetical protein